MSLSSQVMEYLATLRPDELHSASTRDIAEVLEADPERLSKTLWSLENTGRITLKRDGRTISGVESIDRLEKANGRRDLSSKRRERTVPAAHTQRGTVRTPLLDRYEAAKRRAHDLDADEYFDVVFHENPLAEEGLRVRDALARIEAQYAELSTQYKMTLYEYEGVKARLKEKSNGVAKEIHARDAALAMDAAS